MEKVTVAKMREILEEIVGKVNEDWDKKLQHLATRERERFQDLRKLECRTQRLERILERIGTTLLREQP